MQFPAFDYRADAPRRHAVLDALRPILQVPTDAPFSLTKTPSTLSVSAAR
ncbi:hypothetical protein KPSA1_05110 [Pseudomonas syringae pv. actinidiae]|uniref:Uncharacterized protein n=1 Tax=Pseudomonas syringae pv. actinidiae TaxID=103796 RepID=A0A2V0R180_PSESF|nr:hypothetical protein KPSA1_05110 [Pseudomonas syringae pv. actinidiae]GBH18844.1 hypothetical protein KPSA3_04837 [Pseudomonas syringae pv. actinidiae]